MIPRKREPSAPVEAKPIQTVAVTVRDVMFFYGPADVHVITLQGDDKINEAPAGFFIMYEDGSHEEVYKTPALRAVRFETRTVQRPIEAFKPDIH